MKVKVVSQQSSKLLDRLRAEIRLRHYSIRTEEAYVDWARRFILFHGKHHPASTHLPHNLLQAGYDIRTVQELLGHKDVATTMIYTHVLNKGGRGVVSPLDV